jgi:NAD(P)H-dependent flavin oxidoreductase YrpB (nitropropane dioxygenase family)
VASVEAGAPKLHKDLLVSAGFDDVARTVIYTGRPMRVRKTPYVADWYDRVVPPRRLFFRTTDFFLLLGRTIDKKK